MKKKPLPPKYLVLVPNDYDYWSFWSLEELVDELKNKNLKWEDVDVYEWMDEPKIRYSTGPFF